MNPDKGAPLIRKTLAAALAITAGLVAARGLDPVAAGDGGEALRLSSDLRVVVDNGREIQLEVLAREGDDAATIARRVSGDPALGEALAAWNPSGGVAPGRWVRVPLALLSADMRAMVLETQFPQDHRDGDDWVHLARAGTLPTYDEGLWQVARWFTGRGENFSRLLEVNRLASPELRPGQRIRIPAALLHVAFTPRLRSDDGRLEFHTDDDGPYAIYRLRRGEALYSSVVVPFTGRTGAEDVVAVAGEIGKRSGIPDLRDIPAGFAVKIPLDLLEPEFLPASHPRRLEVEARREEVAQELKRQPAAGTRGGLDGVLVVLDPGHGGRDLGTVQHGIWEHDYVYDVTCRLKQKLERQTGARVVMTMEDRETGCEPSTSDRLVRNHQGTILTSPPFMAVQKGEAKIGVNLRWYLANSVYREAKRDGRDPERVVFVSLHADSRHPALRGLMVYVPGAGYRTKVYGHDTRTYRKFKEVREQPLVRYSKKDRLRSEAVSRKLADAIVDGFKRHALPIQPYQPVRDKVVRGKQRYVPAVLRGNAVPAKVLVEMVNLSNSEDAALLQSARERERLAEALLTGLTAYFGESTADIAATTTAQ